MLSNQTLTNKILTNKIQFRIIFLVVVLLQLWFILNQQLFGDEAFYWLEGQYFSLSYADLPGWTAWMIRLGTDIFGDNYFGVRIVSYLGFLSIFRAVWLINKSLSQALPTQYLLLLAVPLFVLLATMALPDIWLTIFVMWIIVFFIKAIDSKGFVNWGVLGVIIALSINVHVRMWIWLFVAGIAFLWVYYKQATTIKPLAFITLPIALLGFVPIVWFNIHNDFALFAFQFSDRHPWQFQPQNISFLLSQLLVITPLMFLLWLKVIVSFRTKPPIIKWVLMTAILHWLLYVFLSLFADGLRTTVHWLLISYVPVLAILTSAGGNYKVFSKWAVISGLLASLLLLLFLNFYKSEGSNIQARILDNSTGWHELSLTVSKIQKQQGIDNIVTDYFMTAAELAFELGKPNSIKVLPHVKNIKHGRQKQLQLLGMLLEKPEEYKQQALLVVEDSTLKLQDKGEYYTQLCNYFKSMELIESVHIAHSNKLFHVFKINSGKLCEIPPLFYIQHNSSGDHVQFTGWVILHGQGIQQLFFKSGEKEILINSNRLENKGVTIQFPEIKDINMPYVGFEVEILKTQISSNSFQLKALGNNNKSYLSQSYYLD